MSLYFKYGKALKRSKPEYLPINLSKLTFGRKVKVTSLLLLHKVIHSRVVVFFFRSKKKKLQQKSNPIFLLAFLVLPALLCAQLDTVLFVPTVEVMTYKIRSASVGMSYTDWDKEGIDKNKYLSVGDLLQRESNVYVKSYGGNSLATMSVRGSSGSQTLVLWNGLPVQSAMLGLLDLSLLPLNFSDKVSLQLGGNSSSWGSGAIGGVLSLENEADFNQKIGLNYHSSFGSFGNLNQQLKLKFGTKHFQSDTRLIYQKAKNDIIYRPDPSLPRARQNHAAFEQAALLQSFYVQANKNNKIGLHFWLQQSNKELPATLTQRRSEAGQEDKFRRFLLTYDLIKGKKKLSVKSGYFVEKQKYEDPQIGLIANNDFSTILGEISLALPLNKNHALEFTNTNSFTAAKSKSYVETQTLFRTAFIGVYKFEKNNLSIQGSLREEVVNGKFLWPTAFLGSELKLSQSMLLKAKITRDFRLPTLNDLFWSPGGNPDLLPEQGWSEEIGFVFNKKIKKHEFSWSQTGYNRNINNWILWAPSTNSFYWSASNIAKVWSWGTESRLDYQYETKKGKLHYVLCANYTSSTYGINLDLPKIEKGDQLLYTPKYQINSSIEYQLGPLAFKYQHLFFGKTTGANDEIPSYHIGNVQMGYKFIQNKTSGTVFIALNNIYNQNYIVIERRPMPGINYQIGMNINFNK